MNPSENARFRARARSRSPLPTLQYLPAASSPPSTAPDQSLHHGQKLGSSRAEAPTRFRLNRRLFKRSPLPPPALGAHTQALEQAAMTTSLVSHPPELVATCKTSLLPGSGPTVPCPPGPRSTMKVGEPNKVQGGKTSAQGRAREINSGVHESGPEKGPSPSRGGHQTPDKAGHQGHTIATQVPGSYNPQAPGTRPCASQLAQRSAKARLGAATAPCLWGIKTSRPLFTLGVIPRRRRGRKPLRRPRHRPSRLARLNPFNIRKRSAAPKPPPPRMRWGRNEEPPPSKLRCLEAQEPDPMEEAMEHQWRVFKNSQRVHILENNLQPLTTSRHAGGTPGLQQRPAYSTYVAKLCIRPIIVPAVPPPLPPSSGHSRGLWRKPDPFSKDLMPGRGAPAENVAFGPSTTATLAAPGRSESPMDISVGEGKSTPPAREPPKPPSATTQKPSTSSTAIAAAASGPARDSESDSDSEDSDSALDMECECSFCRSLSPPGGPGMGSGDKGDTGSKSVPSISSQEKKPLRVSQIAKPSTVKISGASQTPHKKNEEKKQPPSDEEMDLS